MISLNKDPLSSLITKIYCIGKCLGSCLNLLIFNSVDVPPIEKLIDEEADADDEFTDLKWTLLFWILHMTVDDDVKRKIRNLPRGIAPVVVSVLFLLWVISIISFRLN